jgi:hypothetical protein
MTMMMMMIQMIQEVTLVKSETMTTARGQGGKDNDRPRTEGKRVMVNHPPVKYMRVWKTQNLTMQ